MPAWVAAFFFRFVVCVFFLRRTLQFPCGLFFFPDEMLLSFFAPLGAGLTNFEKPALPFLVVAIGAKMAVNREQTKQGPGGSVPCFVFRPALEHYLPQRGPWR